MPVNIREQLEGAELDAVVSAYARDEKLDFVFVEGTPAIEAAYNARVIPNVVIVDDAGVLRHTGAGFHSTDALNEVIDEHGS